MAAANMNILDSEESLNEARRQFKSPFNYPVPIVEPMYKPYKPLPIAAQQTEDGTTEKSRPTGGLFGSQSASSGSGFFAGQAAGMFPTGGAPVSEAAVFGSTGQLAYADLSREQLVQRLTNLEDQVSGLKRKLSQETNHPRCVCQRR